MTIYYKTKNLQVQDHARIMLTLRGSVLSKTVLPCTLGVSVFLIIRYLNEYNDEEVIDGDNTFDDDDEQSTNPQRVASFRMITLLLSFALIIVSNIAYGRYMKAASGFYHFHFRCKSLALKVASYTGMESSENAKLWRQMVKSDLIRFVEAASDILQEPDKVKSMMEDCNYEADMDGEPWELLRTLAHTLGKQKALLHETIPIQKDISMYNDLGVISTTFGDLCAVVSTPIPFPLFNLMQVLLSVWVFAVPFFQTNYSLKNLPFIFFAIYVRVGLNVVACEITDPFGGDDLNDVEVKIFAKATIAQIKHILRDDLMHFFEVVPSDYGKSEDDAANTTFSSSSNSSQIGTFQYHSQLGISALKLQQCNEALSCFRQATCLVSSPRETATIMELIGDVYISQGRHGQANKCFEMASIASKAPQSVLLCSNILGMRVLRKLAELHFDSGQYRAALESYSELLPCYMDRHNRCEEETMIHLMHRIGLLCFLFGEHEKALNQFWSALRIKRDRMKYNNLSYFASLEGLKSRSDNLEVAHLLLCLGMVHQERGEIKLALSKCEEALVYHKILQLDGDVPLDMTSSLLARIGKLYAQIGKNADSNKTVSMMRILVPAILTNHRRTKYKQKSVCNNLPKGISWEDTQIISKTLHKASSPPTPANQKVSNAWHDDS